MVANGTNMTTNQFNPTNTLFLLRALVGTLILATNIFIFYIFHCKKSLIKVPPNLLILSLSLCHFLTGVIFWCTTIMKTLLMFQKPTNESFKYRIMVDILMVFFVKATILHLSGLTIDRYISLFYVLRYKALVTSKSLKTFIVLAWII